jgi:hypothetical protein
MKKIIIIPVITMIYGLLNTPGVFCQPTQDFAIAVPRIQKNNAPRDDSASYVPAEKKGLNSINIRVVRAFMKDFKDAENVSWFKATNGGCAAQFIKDSVQITASYSSNGTWNYTLKRYAEKRMSTDLRTLVKSSFFDYAIQEVVEILLPNEEEIIYRIMIKNGDEFKILMICSGEFKVINEYSQP